MTARILQVGPVVIFMDRGLIRHPDKEIHLSVKGRLMLEHLVEAAPAEVTIRDFQAMLEANREATSEGNVRWYVNRLRNRLGQEGRLSGPWTSRGKA